MPGRPLAFRQITGGFYNTLVSKISHDRFGAKAVRSPFLPFEETNWRVRSDSLAVSLPFRYFCFNPKRTTMKRNISYVVMGNEHYTALEIGERIRIARPGYRLLGMTEDSEQSTEMLENNDVDLIIADIHLSDGDSVDAIRKSGRTHTPVVLATPYRRGNPTYGDLNVFAYMVKPISDGELMKMIVQFEQSYYQNTSIK